MHHHFLDMPLNIAINALTSKKEQAREVKPAIETKRSNLEVYWNKNEKEK